MAKTCLLLLALATPLRAAPVSESELAPIVDLIYDVQFDSAAAAVERLVKTRPEDPSGLFYRGMIAYQSYALLEQNSSATLKAFEQDIQDAAALASAWLSTRPVEGYYYLGAAEGFHARMLVAQKRFLKALPEGIRSIKHLRRALELDPKLEDAYLGVGMYHYFRTRIPTAAKPFAFLFFGEWGDAELGKKELWRAVEKGALAKSEARSILAAIYCSDEEARWDKAAVLLRELMERYPHNPLYRLRAAYVAERRGQWDEAAALADPDGIWLSALTPDIRNRAHVAALYRAVEALVLAGHPENAERALRHLESASLQTPLLDWVLLRRANVMDWEGNDNEADRIYRTVRDPEAAKAAKHDLKFRYPPGLKAVKPLTGLEAPS